MLRRDLSIREVEEGNLRHSRYEVNFYNDVIHVYVTRYPEMVTMWLKVLEIFHRPRLDRLIVGVDVKLCGSHNHRNQTVAIIQLCVGYRCLIFQTNTIYQIPAKLYDFFEEETYTFVGVGIDNDAEMLYNDLGVRLGGRVLDLRTLAAERRRNDSLRDLDLEGLTRMLLRRSIETPSRILTGRWDDTQLDPEQIEYACLEAFVSFRIGKLLNASRDVN